MRICPVCGHHDPDWWRPRSNRAYCEYTKAETLAFNEPKLMEAIRDAAPDPYIDGHFIYHITRTGLNVERIELELYRFMKWGSEPQEAVPHRPHGRP